MLCNTTIGIGIFALPYVAMKTGIFVMLVYFAVLGAIVAAIHWMFAEISLKTPDYKRLPGFARIHLGSWGEITAYVSIVVGFTGSLVAFMAIGGQFLHNALAPIIGGSPDIYSIVYLAAGAVLVYFGINLVEKIEFWGLLMFFAILAALAIAGIPHFKAANLAGSAVNFGDLLLPYGPILFSLWASSSIPEVEEMLGRKRKKKLLKPIVLWASLIAAMVYVFFTLFILGVSGQATSQSALSSLGLLFGPELMSLVFFLGFLTTFTSFVIMGLTLKKILAYDLGIKPRVAWLATAATPLALYMMGMHNFIAIFSFVGGVMLGIDGILILLMYKKIKPGRAYITYPLLAVFTAGIVYQLVYLMR